MSKAALTLDASFFDRDPILVSHDLIGTTLVRVLGGKVIAGRIVETEAYLPFGDAAAHGARGPKKRNLALFMGPGTIYIHAMHRQICLDIVTQGCNRPGSVLIRALEPMNGIELMTNNRGTRNNILLTSGPGRLCQALSITKEFDRQNITYPAAPLRIIASDDSRPVVPIVRTQRIGLTKAARPLLRFCLAGNPYLSRKVSPSECL